MSRINVKVSLASLIISSKFVWHCLSYPVDSQTYRKINRQRQNIKHPECTVDCRSLRPQSKNWMYDRWIKFNFVHTERRECTNFKSTGCPRKNLIFILFNQNSRRSTASAVPQQSLNSSNRCLRTSSAFDIDITSILQFWVHCLFLVQYGTTGQTITVYNPHALTF